MPDSQSISLVPDTSALLDVRDLHVSFDSDEGRIKVLKGVSFTLGHKRILGVVGESGCGKSVTARAIMRILDRSARIDDGTIEYSRVGSETIDLAKLKSTDRRLRA